MSIIYEVNLEIETNTAPNFITWLNETHIPEMLHIDGFMTAQLHKDESKKDGFLLYTCQYTVESREKLEEYFSKHSAKMRKHGQDLFGGFIFVSDALYSVFPMNRNLSNVAHVKHTQLARLSEDGKLLNGNMVRLENPVGHFTFLEPLKGCGNGKASPIDIVASRKCKFATNAGFFEKKSGKCHGNVVIDGKIVQRSPSKMAQFLITKNSKFIVGYIGDKSFDEIDKVDGIQHMISGLIWLVKDGKNNVDSAVKYEDSRIQETGTWSTFIEIRASRIAIGHDKGGQLLIVGFDGDGNVQKGLNLHELADYMISLGAINAINLGMFGEIFILDGGGSMIMLKDNVPISYASDGCASSEMSPDQRCIRDVSTMTCIYDSNESTEKTPLPQKGKIERPEITPKPLIREEIVYYSNDLWKYFSLITVSILVLIAIYYAYQKTRTRSTSYETVSSIEDGETI